GLAELGYRLVSTRGTAEGLRQAGVAGGGIPKIQEGGPNLIDYMKNKQGGLGINTPSGRGMRTDGGEIRGPGGGAGGAGLPAAAQAAVEACAALRNGELTVMPLQERYSA